MGEIQGGAHPDFLTGGSSQEERTRIIPGHDILADKGLQQGIPGNPFPCLQGKEDTLAIRMMRDRGALRNHPQ